MVRNLRCFGLFTQPRWIPDWAAAYPHAQVFLAPGVQRQAAGRIAGAYAGLEAHRGYPWDAEIATLPVASRYMTEVVFWHPLSRTLILTDLIENFEVERVASPLMRVLIGLGAVRAPDGQTPRDLRLTFWRRRSSLRAAVRQMIAWNPEHVILAHGRWFDHGGAAELKRAFRWTGV